MPTRSRSTTTIYTTYEASKRTLVQPLQDITRTDRTRMQTPWISTLSLQRIERNACGKDFASIAEREDISVLTAQRRSAPSSDPNRNPERQFRPFKLNPVMTARTTLIPPMTLEDLLDLDDRVGQKIGPETKSTLGTAKSTLSKSYPNYNQL